MEISLNGDFAKVDDEQRLAFGWAYVAGVDGNLVVDHSGDFVDDEVLPDLEKAAYDYVLVSREADEMHIRLDGIAKMVESVFVTPDKLQSMGLEGDRVGWWVGFKVSDDDVWQKVKSGQYSAFSIRGRGQREDV